MRTFEELIGACKQVVVAGRWYDETGTFEDGVCAVLPDMTGDEETQHYDNLLTHWYDHDYMFVFSHDDTIDGYEADNFRVMTHVEVR